MNRAREAGADEREIRIAVEVARVVQNGAMRSMDAAFGTAATERPPAGGAAKGCSCG